MGQRDFSPTSLQYTEQQKKQMQKKIQWTYSLAATGILLAAAGVAVCELRSKPDAGAGANESTYFHGDQKKMKTAISVGKSVDARKKVGNGALEKYAKAGNAAEKIAILNSAVLISDTKLLELVYKALEDPDSDVRFAAAQMLDRFDANTVIPAISKALGDTNEETRLVAVFALAEADVPETAKLLAKALGDDSEDVRSTVFSIAFTKDTSTKEAILEGASGSQYRDVKERLIELAVDTPSPRTVDTLLRILKDADEELKKGIFSVLEVFFSKEFKTCDAATNWWARNKCRFDGVNDKLSVKIANITDLVF
ncbi:MAG: HEAT repeat domain-containing protein [Lentisphaerae bacterium]|nr:HEAT repeat domain-containing protein [Lentisphaerota bacterium]